ncbi:PaaI family thioesterase [Luteimonas suaedae]|uniref:PaaI family thioesterase n=1 Tax=Luteimonas suaedae TaxID=2605430 RepID=UPI0011EF3335|nr:PaaI family thioesterase [Luteimonas suaedae]
MPLSLHDAQQVLHAQPFSELLGAELVQFSAEGIELRVPISEQLKQQHGFVHGGVIAYAADNALTFAGGFALGPSVVTSEFKINYVRPVLGRVLIARAVVVHAGRKQAVCRCEISSQDGDTEVLCALAQGTISTIDRRDDA